MKTKRELLLEIMKMAAQMIGLVIALSIILTLVFAAVFCIPVNETKYNNSMDLVKEEGAADQGLAILYDILRRSYTNESRLTGHEFVPGTVSSRLDYYNLERAYGDKTKSALYNAISMLDYPRYWHGHVAVLRLLLVFFDLTEIRFFSFIIQMLLVVFLLAEIKRVKGWIPALLFFTSYILIMPMVTVWTTSDFPEVDAIYLCSLIFLMLTRKDRRYTQGRKLAISFCMIGCVACCFNKLVNPILGWTLPALLKVYLYGEEKSVFDNLKTVIISGISWLVGFGGLWACKIAIATVYLGKGALNGAMSEATQWTNGSELISHIPLLYGLYLNYKYYLYPLFYLIIVGWIVFLLVRKGNDKIDNRIASLFLVALAPIGWQIVLRNHVVWHNSLTYRQLGIAVVAVFAGLSVSPVGLLGIGGDKKKLIRRLCLYFAVFVGAVLITFAMREHQLISNSNIPGHYVYIEDNAEAVMNLNPVYKDIDGVTFAFETEDENGNIELTLYEDGSAIDTVTVSASDYVGGTWKDIAVKWHFKKNRKYTVSIKPVETAGKFGLYVLDDNGSGINELSDLMIGNEPSDHQAVAAVTYYRRPLRNDFIFYFFTWYAFIMAAVMSAISIVGEIKSMKRRTEQV